MVDAARQGAEAHGYSLVRVPGRGLSNIWTITKDGMSQKAAIRTTRDRWFAFPPLNGRWKTLNEVDVVIVATVDSRDEPENVEVYIFPADDVRSRFDAAYAARIKEGRIVKDNFGMWVSLDRDDRGIASSVGSGIIDKYERVARYAIDDLLAASEKKPSSLDEVVVEDDASEAGPATIAEVMEWARHRVADIAGVSPQAVKLDLKVEY
jgi:hypothetical protein